MSIHRSVAFALTASFFVGCSHHPAAVDLSTPTDATINVLPASEVQWNALNPARGDRSPQAATIWGDRGGEVPTGFLVKFVDGFSSPPHIHNVTYRGVVIHGLVHNDDPDAAKMWMPPGSYWTQPAGEVHITAAKGQTNVALIEIAQGPYLVLPPAEAFDNGERPVNIDPSNFVWLDANNTSWIDSPLEGGPKLVHLWGTPHAGQLNASLLKLPPGFSGHLQTEDTFLHAVVIQGQPTHQVLGKSESQSLEPGSSFKSEGLISHALTNENGENVILYVRIEGRYKVTGDLTPVTDTTIATAKEPRVVRHDTSSQASVGSGSSHSDECAICLLNSKIPATHTTKNTSNQ